MKTKNENRSLLENESVNQSETPQNLNVEELMAVEGGFDNDEDDDDCTVFECVLNGSYCYTRA